MIKRKLKKMVIWPIATFGSLASLLAIAPNGYEQKTSIGMKILPVVNLKSEGNLL